MQVATTISNVAWDLAVGFGVLTAIAILTARREMRKENPESAGPGWFGPRPDSKVGRTAYRLMRVFVVLAILLAALAVGLSLST